MHFSFDAVLVSALIAGVRRNTGLTLRSNTVENKDAQTFIAKYLEVGEWMLDTSATIMRASGYFERRLP